VVHPGRRRLWRSINPLLKSSPSFGSRSATLRWFVAQSWNHLDPIDMEDRFAKTGINWQPGLTSQRILWTLVPRVSWNKLEMEKQP
jgi:hypothetical protein